MLSTTVAIKNIAVPSLVKMKLVISLLVVVLVVSIDALPNSQALHRSKRGFRMGAADRFSHGFGKRTDLENALSDGDDNSALMTIEELASLLQSSPRLSYMVAKTVDRNADGVITREELFPKYPE